MKVIMFFLIYFSFVNPVHAMADDTSYNLKWVIENSQMTKTAKNLFTSLSPILATNISESCGKADHAELRITYGCYNSAKEKIYIKKTPGKGLEGMMAVAAVHETLHAVYHNLPEKLKATINSYIDKEMEGPNREQILSLLRGYKIGDFYNEAHSFIATEVLNVDPIFENYYSALIHDRKRFVSKKLSSDVVKNKVKDIADMNSELDQLKKKLDLRNDKLDLLEKVIRPLKDELNSLESQGDYKTYNKLVSIYNTYTDLYKSVSDDTIKDLEKGKDIALTRDALQVELLNLLATLSRPTDLKAVTK